MKILHVLHGFPPEHEGGTEKYVARLAIEQARAGAEVTVAAGSFREGEARFVEVETERSHRLFRLSKRGFANDRWDHGAAPHVGKAFDDLLADLEPDLVHVHQWIRLTRDLVRRAARRRVPAVVTLHDLYTSCPRIFRVRDDEAFCELPLSVDSCLGCVPRESWMGDEELALQIERFAHDFSAELGAAAAIVAPSASHLETVRRFVSLDVDKAHVVAHASTCEQGRVESTITQGALEPAAPVAGAKRLRLAHWGHLLPHKGVHVLLEALHAPDLVDACELELWGPSEDEAYERRLADLAEGLHLERRSHFRGEDLSALQADVAVFPSLAHESWSFVIDEAFGLGLPVIASDRGAPRDRVGDAGLLVPVADVEALRDAIRALRNDASRLASMRAAIPTPTTIKEHWSELASVYEKAIAGGPGATDPVENEIEWERVAVLYEARARAVAVARDAADEEVEALRQELRRLWREAFSERR